MSPSMSPMAIASVPQATARGSSVSDRRWRASISPPSMLSRVLIIQSARERMPAALRASRIPRSRIAEDDDDAGPQAIPMLR